MKISEVFRKRALFGVAVFCITAIATVGTLSVGVDEEDNTPNNLVDLNETNDSENTIDKAEISGSSVGDSTGNSGMQVGDTGEISGVHAGTAAENTGVSTGDNEENTGLQVGSNTENADAAGDTFENTDVQVGNHTENPEMQVGDNTEASGLQAETIADNIEKTEIQVSDNTENPEIQVSDTAEISKNTETPTEVLSPAVLAEQLNFDKSTGLLWPVAGQVMIPYSPDHGVFYRTLDQFAISEAVVLSSTVGTEVKAAAKGVVTSIEEDVRTGTTVTLALGNNTSLVYGQLNVADLKEGDVLEAGECIGTVAEPTRYYVMEGPNLYFKVLEGETTIDPAELLKEEQAE